MIYLSGIAENNYKQTLLLPWVVYVIQVWYSTAFLPKCLHHCMSNVLATMPSSVSFKTFQPNGLHQGHSKQFNHMVFTSLIQTFWPPDLFHQCHFNGSVTRPSLVSIKHFSHKAFIGVFQTFWTLGLHHCHSIIFAVDEFVTIKSKNVAMFIPNNKRESMKKYKAF